MLQCRCGAELRRIHRTFAERFRYMAVFECKECGADHSIPQPYYHHFGPYCRCPLCGTYRLSRLRERDRIDRMNRSFLNLWKFLIGGRLVHCRFCRMQFYDRRPLASEATPTPTGEMAKNS